MYRFTFSPHKKVNSLKKYKRKCVLVKRIGCEYKQWTSSSVKVFYWVFQWSNGSTISFLVCCKTNVKGCFTAMPENIYFGISHLKTISKFMEVTSWEKYPIMASSLSQLLFNFQYYIVCLFIVTQLLCFSAVIMSQLSSPPPPNLPLYIFFS